MQRWQQAEEKMGKGMNDLPYKGSLQVTGVSAAFWCGAGAGRWE